MIFRKMLYIKKKWKKKTYYRRKQNHGMFMKYLNQCSIQGAPFVFKYMRSYYKKINLATF